VESRLRCAVGSSDGSDGEINHFFAYDERAFQRGALHALAFPEHSILPPSAMSQSQSRFPLSEDNSIR
jgi:hypothetical protein